MRRPDISNGLIHLTSQRGDVSAFDVLCKILTTAKLIGSGNKGFVKGTQRAVCFSEAPLSAIPHLIQKSKELSETHNKTPYSSYGIAVSKESIYKLDGRPVIYLPDEEAGWISADQVWRQVRFEPPKIDWSHEREWRVPVDELSLLDLKGFYVLGVPLRK